MSEINSSNHGPDNYTFKEIPIMSVHIVQNRLPAFSLTLSTLTDWIEYSSET